MTVAVKVATSPEQVVVFTGLAVIEGGPFTVKTALLLASEEQAL